MINKSVTIIAVAVFFFLFCKQGSGADWKRYANNIFLVAYYDATTITEVSRGSFRVWEKWSHTAEGKKDAAKKLGPKYLELDHMIVLSEINCAERKYRIIQGTDYTNDGTVIHTGPNVDRDWNFVIPDSTAEALLVTLCPRE